MTEYIYSYCLQKLEGRKITTVDGIVACGMIITQHNWEQTKAMLVAGIDEENRDGDWAFTSLVFLHEIEETTK